MILTGTGREPSEDPYYRRIYSANLDGKHLKLLTTEDADHVAAVSGDGKFIVDIYSTPQKPQVMVLRDQSGQVIEEMAHGDITRLKAAGWIAPETFHVKGHDGKTDVYGLLFRPANLDPSRKYPIIDYIYPGPARRFLWDAFISSLSCGLQFARGAWLHRGRDRRHGKPQAVQGFS